MGPVSYTHLALVRWGTTPMHESLVSTIGAIAEEAAARRITPPCGSGVFRSIPAMRSAIELTYMKWDVT